MCEDTVRVCPHCRTTGLQFCQRSGAGTRLAPADDPHWLCHGCGARVDEPAERERQARKWAGHEKLRRAGFGHLVEDGGESE
jgi:hypothetical protein